MVKSGFLFAGILGLFCLEACVPALTLSEGWDVFYTAEKSSDTGILVAYDAISAAILRQTTVAVAEGRPWGHLVDASAGLAYLVLGDSDGDFLTWNLRTGAAARHRVSGVALGSYPGLVNHLTKRGELVCLGSQPVELDHVTGYPVYCIDPRTWTVSWSFLRGSPDLYMPYFDATTDTGFLYSSEYPDLQVADFTNRRVRAERFADSGNLVLAIVRRGEDLWMSESSVNTVSAPVIKVFSAEDFALRVTVPVGLFWAEEQQQIVSDLLVRGNELYAVSKLVHAELGQANSQLLVWDESSQKFKKVNSPFSMATGAGHFQIGGEIAALAPVSPRSWKLQNIRLADGRIRESALEVR